ncbi:MAG: cytochrome c3 family protein [Fidelibacterota bacterium]
MKVDPSVRLDKNNKVQCTSCHDAHSDKNFASSGIHFWAKPTFDEVCSGCHIF